VTRIIAGRAGGRRLVVPRGDRTRPTSERVREAIFAALQSQGRLVGARVLDLFSGCGALGLEAASRGATSVTLVDSARSATEAARRNVSTLGLPGVDVVRAPVERYLGTAAPAPVDLVFADPPYELPEPGLARVLDLLTTAGWLAPDAAVVVERSARSPEPGWPHGLARTGSRRYGDTAVWTAEWGVTRPPDPLAEASRR
jgi:16S rRNA (guanine966-N2)-methyltransferase